jgi:hypothetical protein
MRGANKTNGRSLFMAGYGWRKRQMMADDDGYSDGYSDGTSIQEYLTFQLLDLLWPQSINTLD